MIKALGYDEASVRFASASALGRIGDIQAVEFLIIALKDQSSLVRRNAAWALKQITGQDFGVDIERWQQWWKKKMVPSANVKKVKCLHCGIPLLTETEAKRKYPMGLFVGTIDDLAQIERDRNAIGVTCAVCGRSFCSGCMLKSGKPHPKSGGLACLECGGHLTHFKG